MDSQTLIQCIGRPDDAPEIVQLLDDLGVKKKPRVPKDDIEARVSLKKLGMELIFEPVEKKSSRLQLNAVQFYSDAEQGFKTFAGALPGGVTMADSRTEVHAKLGKPNEVKKAFGLDRWKKDGLQLTVEYVDDDIGLITVELPLKKK